MNGYKLTRNWFDYKFENPSTVRAIHTDFYIYLVDQWNRLGKKDEFGLPTSYTMECLGIGSYNTYKKTLSDLVSFGFVKIVKDSKNQHISKIIAISKYDEASDKPTDKALDEATIKASDKPTDTIVKQYNNLTIEQINNILSFFNSLNINEIDNYIFSLKVIETDKIDFEKLREFINSKTGRDFKVVNKSVKSKYLARLKDGYSKQDILNAVSNAVKNDYHKENNFKYLTLEFFSRSDTLDKYSNTSKNEDSKQQKTAVTYSGPFQS